jgi:hypothetical protein
MTFNCSVNHPHAASDYFRIAVHQLGFGFKMPSVLKLTADMKRVVTEQRLAFVATVCPDYYPSRTIVVEPRFLANILNGIRNEGLVAR